MEPKFYLDDKGTKQLIQKIDSEYLKRAEIFGEDTASFEELINNKIDVNLNVNLGGHFESRSFFKIIYANDWQTPSMSTRVVNGKTQYIFSGQDSTINLSTFKSSKGAKLVNENSQFMGFLYAPDFSTMGNSQDQTIRMDANCIDFDISVEGLSPLCVLSNKTICVKVAGSSFAFCPEVILPQSYTELSREDEKGFIVLLGQPWDLENLLRYVYAIVELNVLYVK